MESQGQKNEKKGPFGLLEIQSVQTISNSPKRGDNGAAASQSALIDCFLIETFPGLDEELEALAKIDHSQSREEITPFGSVDWSVGATRLLSKISGEYPHEDAHGASRETWRAHCGQKLAEHAVALGISPPGARWIALDYPLPIVGMGGGERNREADVAQFIGQLCAKIDADALRGELDEIRPPQDADAPPRRCPKAL